MMQTLEHGVDLDDVVGECGGDFLPARRIAVASRTTRSSR
jgi:hypothetical protein